MSFLIIGAVPLTKASAAFATTLAAPIASTKRPGLIVSPAVNTPSAIANNSFGTKWPRSIFIPSGKKSRIGVSPIVMITVSPSIN